MASRTALVFTAVILCVMSASSLYAQATDSTATKTTTPSEPARVSRYFTVSGGWSWPAGGPVEDSYQDGYMVAASFMKGLKENYLGGFEVGYSVYSLDSGKLAGLTPASTYSGGDMGLLSITTENDYLFGSPERAMLPFVNLGIGYYKSFIDDARVTTGTTVESFSTGVYEGSFFGFHAGIGALLHRERFGLRIDASYQHLFAGGKDLEFFTARGGLVFYLD